MQQHTLDVMRKLIWVLLEILLFLQQRKNYANRSRIDRIIAMIRVAQFFLTHAVLFNRTSSSLRLTSIGSNPFTADPVKALHFSILV